MHSVSTQVLTNVDRFDSFSRMIKKYFRDDYLSVGNTRIQEVLRETNQGEIGRHLVGDGRVRVEMPHLSHDVCPIGGEPNDNN